MANITSTKSYKPHFKKFKILTVRFIHTYDTWSKSDLFTSCHNTTLFEQSITYTSLITTNFLMEFKALHV